MGTVYYICIMNTVCIVDMHIYSIYTFKCVCVHTSMVINATNFERCSLVRLPRINSENLSSIAFYKIQEK